MAWIRAGFRVANAWAHRAFLRGEMNIVAIATKRCRELNGYGTSAANEGSMDHPRLVIPAFECIYRAAAPITEPLMRMIAGGSLAIHGFPILFGNTSAAAKFLESIGFDNALFWAYVVGIVEFVCGLCLAIGFLTRLVAIPIIGFLLVAIVTYHRQFGFAWENRGIEYPLFWAIVVFHFLIHGGGRWSVDTVIGREV